MKCPECGNPTKTLETRKNQFYIRRRRDCVICGHRLTTYETAQSAESIHFLKELEELVQNAQSGKESLTDITNSFVRYIRSRRKLEGDKG